MEGSYRKDLSHLTWDEVFARQRARANLVDDWMAALHLQPGACVLDIGAGPGYVSLMLADLVGLGGLVYAVDRSADALDYLARMQRQRGIMQIHRIVADATAFDIDSRPPDSALISMVLHHANEPAAILTNAAHLLPQGAIMVIAEFHPDGPCQIGPPRAERLSPDQLTTWSDAAGFAMVAHQRQTDEHYFLILQRC